MAEPPECDSERSADPNDPEVCVVLVKAFRPNRLLPQELELLGSILPELVRELIQMDEGER